MAFADALDDGARVLLRLSARLRALHLSDHATTRQKTPAVGSAAELPRATPLGQRQLAVLGLDDRNGLSASEVGKVLGYTPSNATNLLKRLQELGYLDRVPGERPARWRRAAAPRG